MGCITLVPKVFLLVASITWGCTSIYRPLSYPFRSLKLSTTIYLVLNSGSLDPSPCPQTSLTGASAGPTREARVVAPLETEIYTCSRIYMTSLFFRFFTRCIVQYRNPPSPSPPPFFWNKLKIVGGFFIWLGDVRL